MSASDEADLRVISEVRLAGNGRPFFMGIGIMK
jgi:hypothetical protein